MDNKDGIGRENSEDDGNHLTPESREKLRLFIEEKLPSQEMARQRRRYQTSPRFREMVDGFYQNDSHSKDREQAMQTAFAELCALFSPLMENAENRPMPKSVCRPSPAQVDKMWQKLREKMQSA